MIQVMETGKDVTLLVDTKRGLWGLLQNNKDGDW